VITLTLTSEDARVLADTLTHDLSELRMEISHTDSLDFREGLKRKKAALRRILDALESSVTGPA
jgi:hypothetical protein